MTQPTALYRWYSEDGELLYIGIAYNPMTRAAQHESEQAWWTEIASSAVQWFPDRDQALSAERAAINTENPKYNRQRRIPYRTGTQEWLQDRALVDLASLVGLEARQADDLLSGQSAAAVLNLHVKTIDRLRDSGRLPETEVGGQRFYRVGDVLALFVGERAA